MNKKTQAEKELELSIQGIIPTEDENNEKEKIEAMKITNSPLSADVAARERLYREMHERYLAEEEEKVRLEKLKDEEERRSTD